MSGGWLSRIRGGGGEQKPLQSDLKVLTESNVIEVPKDALTMVVEATKVGEEERREVMTHLRSCLAEPAGRLWRRMYAGLLLTEELLKTGAPELWVETAEGRHFDILQRLSLLEKFECTNDTRVQVMVRNKASSLRAKVIRCLDNGGELADAADEPGSKATKSSPSSGSSNGASKTSSTTASSYSSSSSSLRPEVKTEGQMVLNGIVAVGHNDDTDSEDSGDDGGYRKAVAFRQPKQAPVISTAVRSTPSPVDTKVASQSAPAQEVDLLGGFDAPSAPSQEADLLADAAPAAPAQEVDLLGF